MTIAEAAAAILRGIRDGDEFQPSDRAHLLAGFMTGRGYLKLADPADPRAARLTNIYFVKITPKGLEAIDHPETLDLRGYGEEAIEMLREEPVLKH